MYPDYTHKSFEIFNDYKELFEDILYDMKTIKNENNYRKVTKPSPPWVKPGKKKKK